MGNPKKWWSGERVDNYHQETDIRMDDIYYGPHSPPESELQLLDDVTDKRILEIGCGGAEASIYLANRGADVQGVDISSEQIAFARKRARESGLDIDFYERDMQDLSVFSDESQDIVLSLFALLYVENLRDCFKEVYRVLESNGLFLFSLDHPFFRMFSSDSLRLKKNYWHTGKIEKDFDDYGTFVKYEHTFSEIINPLVNSGFEIEELLEPRNEGYHDPWEGLWEYSERAVEKAPPTLIVKASKP